MDPDAPTVTVTVTSELTAWGAVATTRTVWAPPSSPTAVNATSDVSVRLNSIRLSAICKFTPVTVTAEPSTEADPDKATVSIPSMVESVGAVMLNVPLALTDPAGMVTVTMFPVASVVKSPVDPNVAPLAPIPEATVTVTSTAAVNTDDVPPNAAVTVTGCAPARSGTASGNTDNEISVSASAIARSTEDTDHPGADPENRIVSEPSTTESGVGVMVTSVDPVVAPDAIVTVAEEPAE